MTSTRPAEQAVVVGAAVRCRCRFQMFITDQSDPDIGYLEALQRGRGRAEKLIRNAKDTGLTNLPSADIAINQARSLSPSQPTTCWCGPGSTPSITTTFWLALTQPAPLLPPTHCRDDRPQRPPSPAPRRCALTLGTTTRRRVRPRSRPAPADLSSGPCSGL
jgi:hypothetical protein